MAKAKSKLDFTPAEQEILVEVAAIRYEFDVRVDAHVDEETVKQLVAQGKIGQKPLLTADNVVIDGRTGIEAQRLLLATKDEPEVSQVFVDKVGFKWDSLTAAERAEVKAYALERNFPKTGGFRRFATEQDVVFVVGQFIESRKKREDIFALLDFVPKARLERIYTNARQSFDHKLIADARKYMVEHDLKPSEYADAGKAVGLRKALWDSIPTTEKVTEALNRLKKRQKGIEKAIATLEYYAKRNIEHYRDGILSGKNLLEVTEWQARNVLRLGQKMEDIRKRVQKEIGEKGFHRT